jgi:hypothetical protein
LNDGFIDNRLHIILPNVSDAALNKLMANSGRTDSRTTQPVPAIALQIPISWLEIKIPISGSIPDTTILRSLVHANGCESVITTVGIDCLVVRR